MLDSGFKDKCFMLLSVWIFGVLYKCDLTQIVKALILRNHNWKCALGDGLNYLIWYAII